MIDGGKISFAIVFRWCAYTDKDDFTRADSFAGIGGVGNFLLGDSPFQDFVEMFFVNRDLAGFQLIDTFAVDICAKDFVASGRQANQNIANNTMTMRNAMLTLMSLRMTWERTGLHYPRPVASRSRID